MPPTSRSAMEDSPGSSARHSAAPSACCSQPRAACTRSCATASSMLAREECTISLPLAAWSNAIGVRAIIACSMARLCSDSASIFAVVAALRPAVQAARNCAIQRHCAGSALGTKRMGLSDFSSHFGRLRSTEGEAIGAT